MAAQLWFAEQRVNTATAGAQYRPSITKLANGGFVVVWQDDGVGAGDIRGQLFTAAGVKIGGEIAIASGAGTEFSPEVVALASGGFRVVWDAGSTAAQALYDANGGLTTTSTPYGVAQNFRSAARMGGGYSDVFEFGGDIFFARFTEAGAVVGGSSTNLSNSPSPDERPDIATLTNNGLFSAVVAYVTDTAGLVYTLINSANTAVSGGVVSADGNPKGSISVASLESGGFVVAWYDLIASEIRARVFSPTGSPLTPQFRVNGVSLTGGSFVELTGLKDGGFLVLWRSESSDTVRAAHFDSGGGRLGADFIVSTGATSAAGSPRIVSATLLDDGRVAVVFVGQSGMGDIDNSIRLQILDPRNGQIEGTQGADTLYGGQSADFIIALDGADLLFALSGQDIVYAGAGADTVFGDVGDDILYGGDDNDLLNAGTGADVVYAELGNDTVFAELGDDLIFGGDGNDTINGGAGDDAVYGQNGDDVAFGDTGADAFFLGFGNDTGFLGTGNDVAFGEEGGDTLVGDLGDDVLDGGPGGDVLNGGDGVDNLNGGADGDVLIGGAGGDRIEGGAGGDLIWYQAQTEGNDLIVGFDPAQDQLQFTGSQFGGFTAGSTLSNGTTFVLGAGPTAALPTFYYNAGALFFDADGTGPGAAVFIALLQGAPAITAADFQFV